MTLPEGIARTATHWLRGGKDYGWPEVPGVVDVTVWWPLSDPYPKVDLWTDDASS